MWESSNMLKEYGFCPEVVGTAEELDKIGNVPPSKHVQTGKEARDEIDYICGWCDVVGDVLGREADLRRNLVMWRMNALCGGKRGGKKRARNH